MPFQKGHQLTKGCKTNGRKTKVEEIKQAFEMHKAKITQEALIELANSITFKRLKQIEENEISPLSQAVKEIAMPITLKGMVDKKDLTSGGKPIPILGGISNGIHNDDGNKEVATTEEED